LEDATAIDTQGKDCDRLENITNHEAYMEIGAWNVQTTDIKLGQTHCLALRAPTLDLWPEITKSR
jgi:hypothetical protein